VLSHLLRNAVAHGIEPEAERLERGKPALGNVRIWAQTGPSGTIIRVDDDGRGFDVAAMSAPDAAGAGARQAYAAAFTSGVSTSSAPDGLSGAGVGLSAVQKELYEVGYRIDLVSSSAVGSRIEIAPVPRREGRVQERHAG
jgi:two-component system chemotaxis sensor kinase CheA